jgi:type II secretory pathway predicted ATPase ExeA
MTVKFTEWFGLSAIPFGKDLASKELFHYPQIEELHQKLELTVESRSAALITGRAGTGKTTAVRCFLESLPTNIYRIVYLGYDRKGSAMFARLAQELGLRYSRSQGHYSLQLSKHIEHHFANANRELILVIDEAHFLDSHTLESIRLLTNSRMDRKTNVILILLGQLWLRSTLKHDGHEALYQRTRFRYGLEGLTQQQTKDYIRHHLALVGGISSSIFNQGALENIFFYSGGILREINNLCVDSLFLACNQGKHQIDERLVKLVIDQRDSA